MPAEKNKVNARLFSPRLRLAAAALALIFSFAAIFALAVYAEGEEGAAPAEETADVAEEATGADESDPADDTDTAETTPAETSKPPIEVSDASNVVGIIVAVVIGAGTIALIIYLMPKDKAQKKR